MPKAKENIFNALLEQEQRSTKSEFLTHAEHQWLNQLKQKSARELESAVQADFKPEVDGAEPAGSKFAELKGELGKMEHFASKDSLTALENRRGLFKRGVEYFSEVERMTGGERSISVISMDIDYFKAYNEISHTFGDIALQRVGQVLLEYTKDKSSGFSSRIGGEEIFLLVDSQIPSKDIIKKAEEIKAAINKALQDLFAELDEKKGKNGLPAQAGATKDFLEKTILTETRCSRSFNDEMKKNKPALIKQIQDSLTFKFDVEPTPAEVVLMLIDEIKNSIGARRDELERLRSALGFEAGTITVGGAHVEFKKETVINAEDISEIAAQLAVELNGNEKLVKQIIKEITNKKYDEVYRVLAAAGLETIIEKSKNKRFGKIIHKANELAEQQKKDGRNMARVEVMQMESLDNEGKDPVGADVLRHYNELQRALEDRANEQEAPDGYLVMDQLASGFAKIEAAIREVADETQLRELEELKARLFSTQREKYFDPLTGAKNYEYLTQITPGELKMCADKNQDYAMISFDVDNLKAVNSAGGHKLGDVVLMAVSKTMQEELESIETVDPLLFKKIKKTGLSAALIRATGGEEFIITLPGLNGEEAMELFSRANRRLSEVIKEMTVNYHKEIKEDISGSTFQAADGTQIQKSAEEVEKFGTVTGGVVSLKEASEYLTEDGEINAGKMRQAADMLGERLKRELHEDGTSGRGHIWGLESFLLAQKLDEKIAENNNLKIKNADLHGRLHELRRQLRGARGKTELLKIRKQIEKF